jgi:predicted dehydrogenase
MLDAAIVGMGRWGRVLVDSVQGRNDSPIRFVTGCTGTPEKARDYAAQKGVRLVDGYDQVLADPAVKAVVLATPHGQHAAQVIAAARAGKHVFVEKPFTLSKTDAEAAVAACRDAGVVMALGHNRRFLPAVAQMKAMLAEGAVLDAIETFAAILEEDPENALAYAGLIRAHLMAEDLDKAEALLNAAPAALASRIWYSVLMKSLRSKGMVVVVLASTRS